MNKLYAFFALVLLTACGSPYDGSWKGVDEFVQDYKIEISGDEAKIIVLNNPMSSNNVTCTFSRGDDQAKMICENDGNTAISDVILDGNIMTIKPEGRREATFVKD